MVSTSAKRERGGWTQLKRKTSWNQGHACVMMGAVKKAEMYSHLHEQAKALLRGERDLIPNAANTAALLYSELPDVNWVGFYFRKGEELVLGPFQGKPACIRIPVGKGVCGTAAQSGQSLIVEDVTQFPGHIACDPASRSELVIPLRINGKVVGVLDLDSASPSRFDEADRHGCEVIAEVLLENVDAFIA